MTDIITSINNHILRLQINRPGKKNTLAPAIYDALREAI